MTASIQMYTFILEYAGGTYVSQYKGRSHTEAFRRWLRTEPAKLEKITRLKFAERMARKYAEGEEVVALVGVVNVWCWSTFLPKGLALLNFVKTDPS